METTSCTTTMYTLMYLFNDNLMKLPSQIKSRVPWKRHEVLAQPAHL